MATLQYTAFFSAAEVANGPALNQNVITIGAVAATSPTSINPNASPKNQGMRVRIAVDADCWVLWGSNPTALGNGLGGVMMGPTVSAVEYFDIPADQYISVIERA